MFTGIIQALGKIKKRISDHLSYHLYIEAPQEWSMGIQEGASVAVDGVCLTLVDRENGLLHFELLEETRKKTTLSLRPLNFLIHLEKSLHFGEEIGGHLLTGHVQAIATLAEVTGEKWVFKFNSSDISWINFLFSKGSIALDGVSLTLVDVDLSEGSFSVHLIPDTLKRAHFKQLNIGDAVNVEVDSMALMMKNYVDRSISSYLPDKFKK